jgi:hypothetical protein
MSCCRSCTAESRFARAETHTRSVQCRAHTETVHAEPKQRAAGRATARWRRCWLTREVRCVPVYVSLSLSFYFPPRHIQSLLNNLFSYSPTPSRRSNVSLLGLCSLTLLLVVTRSASFIRLGGGGGFAHHYVVHVLSNAITTWNTHNL